MDINSENFSKILKKLDEKLDFKLKIVICGGISGIIFYGTSRSTGDMDVLNSKPKLSEFQGLIEQVGHELKLNKNWLNDGAKGFSDFLTDDYLKRLVPFSEKFKNLKIFSISKADFFVMKLASGRAQDYEDIENIKLTENELLLVEASIKKINKLDPKKSLQMDLFMKEYNAGN